jgi:1,4-alpha-glucan branching enzyme
MIKTTKPGADGLVKVTFSLPSGEPAGAVSVVGDFNDWDPSAHPLRPRSNQTRSVSVSVPAGSTLRFRYLAEGGRWFDDDTVAVVDEGNSVLAV